MKEKIIQRIGLVKTKLIHLRQKAPMIIERLKKIDRDDLKKVFEKSKRPLKYAFIGLVALLIVIPITTYIYFIGDLSSKDRILNRKNEGVVLLDREGVPFFTLFQARTKTIVPLSKVLKVTQEAFIAVEDRDFYNHPGFSINGILRAIKTNIQRDQFAAGGSTISQQLIKNTLLSQSKNLFRKYQELVLAIELERQYSKDDILELYLNTIYFGENAFGIEDASKRYFSKDVSNLSIAESALLAGIIRAPSYYSPLTGDKEAALKRERIILGLMRDQKYITQDEYEKSVKEDIRFNPTKQQGNDLAVHFALMIQEKLIKEYGEQRVAQAGFIVKTTLDRDLQEVAQKTVADQVINLRGNHVTNGAAVAIDPSNGEVLALVGSHDWNDELNGKINMAVSPRQPGSSFKPLIYAKAIKEKYITAGTVLEDKPVSFGNYKPQDYDKKYRNEVVARFALANSLNIPAVHVMDKVGVKNGIKMAQDMGITTLDEKKDYGLPLVLGAAEVPLIEMTNAYGVFANKGNLTKYILYTQIKDKNGNVISENKSNSKNVLPESVAFIISSMLSDNKARKEIFGDSLTISREAAVKTGTTENYHDALTIGYTPQIVVGAWVGNNDNTKMDSIAGSLGAAPIWRQIIESYLRKLPIKNFQKPSDVLPMSICSENGLKVEVATTSAYTEFYLRGTLPTKICNVPTPTPTPTPSPVPTIVTPTPTSIPSPTISPTIQVSPTAPATSGALLNFSKTSV